MDWHFVIAAGAFTGLSLLLVGARQRRRQSDVASAYLKGFRYVLSDEPDAAIAELTRAPEDARTIETYFALGALFRRTGQHERAIRLHQNMLLKPGFELSLRQQIQLELALDYHRAGMLAQAIEGYEKVLDAVPGHRDALARLREIHEDRHDFARAAEVQRLLLKDADASRSILAHLLAEAALAESEGDLALEFAARAVEVDGASAHAWLAQGLVELKRGEAEGAIEALQRACQLDRELSARAAGALAQACGADRTIAFFEAQLAARDHVATRVALAGRLRQAGRGEVAIGHLRRALEADPRCVEARVELGKALLESSGGEDARRELEALLRALGQQEPNFLCTSCGQGFAEPQFRCPACRGWDTIERCAH